VPLENVGYEEGLGKGQEERSLWWKISFNYRFGFGRWNRDVDIDGYARAKWNTVAIDPVS
jgi:hypothetical protein